MDINYLVLGAGGVGGSVAAFLAKAGKPVTLIARGEHREVMASEGMTFIYHEEEQKIPDLVIRSQEEYLASGEHPDVIFLATKAYSLASIAPFLRDVATESTVVISLLNGIGIGDTLREILPKAIIADGLIYIFAWKDGPGRVYLSGDRMHIFFGSTESGAPVRKLKAIAQDANVPGMKVDYSKDINAEIFRKFSLVGAMAVAGLRFECPMGPLMTDPYKRQFFAETVAEVIALGEKMGVHIDEDMVARNLEILDRSKPTDTTSLQRDIAAGGQSEVATFLALPLSLAEKHGTSLPHFQETAEILGIL